MDGVLVFETEEKRGRRRECHQREEEGRCPLSRMRRGAGRPHEGGLNE